MEDVARQLDEIEALHAMFPEEEGCFVLAPAEQHALKAAQAAVATGDVDALLLNLSGTIKLPGVLLAGSPVCLRFQLPSSYPAAATPHIMVECNAPRMVHERLSSAMADAAQDALGSESLLLLISRLKEEVESVDAAVQQEQVEQQPTAAAAAAAAAAGESGHASPAQVPSSTEDRASDAATGCQHELLRVAIWFHHIKSTQKRKDIVAWARELNIGGYSKPGFPGVITCEGASDDVREYVARIRALQWQAMQVRHEEDVCCHSCKQTPAANGSLTSAGGANNSARVSDVSGPRRGFTQRFAELPETSLSELGQYCKDAGLEHLFLSALKLPGK